MGLRFGPGALPPRGSDDPRAIRAPGAGEKWGGERIGGWGRQGGELGDGLALQGMPPAPRSVRSHDPVAAQGQVLVPQLNDLVGGGKPASTPPLGEMWEAWRTITTAADLYLDSLTPALLQTHLMRDGETLPESVGTMLLRNICHYWFHIGEAHAIRQMLGHTDLPQFVGDMSSALYRPE